MVAVLVDCLGRSVRGRRATVDVLGAGPRKVVGVLLELGVNVHVMPVERLVELGFKRLKDYEVLLVTGMVSDLGAIRCVLTAWRRYSKGPAILGGPVAASCIKRGTMGFDVAVVGEGEETLVDLHKVGVLEGEIPSPEELYRVKGIVFRSGKGHVFTGFREYLSPEDMDRFKSSAEVIKAYPNYWALRVYVEVVRGCSNFYRTRLRLPDGRKCIRCSRCESPNLAERLHCPVGIPAGCGYCSVPTLYGPARSRSIDAIVREVKELIAEGARRIVLSAPDVLDYGRDWLVKPQPLTDPRKPPANIEALEALFSRIVSIPEVMSGGVVVLVENVKASLVTEEVADLLSRYFPGIPLHIGCETGSTRHAKLIGRPCTPFEVVKAVELLSSRGLRPYVYFIHGLPGQNPETVKATLNVMEEVVRRGAEKITVYRFTPLPCSAFEDFPRPPPAVEDPGSSLIVRKARELNMKLKKVLIGRRVKAVVVSPHTFKGRRYFVAYPLRHGPVILLPSGAGRYEGWLVQVVISRVVSDRLVVGELLAPLRPLHVRAQR